MKLSRHSALLILIWLAASCIATALALNYLSAAFVDGQYIPVGNDAFYHARRILDTAIGERGFYQFDNMIHVPEGSWLSWPWGYDYLMAQSLRLVLWLNPLIEPMAFLAYIPVVWVFVNAGLLLLVAREIRLSTELTAIALLAFSLAPTTQELHAVGAIDHHFVELTFTLLSVWLGLRFFANSANTRNATMLGLALGVAPAFHNGLFILQVPVLACFVLLWAYRKPVGKKESAALGISLIISTVAILLPSGPFQNFHFEFGTLSWFHLYIAVSTTLSLTFIARIPLSGKGVGIFVALLALLGVPLAVQIASGVSFLAGNTILLDSIVEVASPLRMYLQSGYSLHVTSKYSWLIVLAPVLILVYGARLLQRRDARDLFFAFAVLFGLLLMLLQYRLHPFGFWALLLTPLCLIDEFRARRQFGRAIVSVACLAALALSFQPPLRYQLFRIVPPGLTRDYAATRSLYPVLAEACAEDSGIALVYSDDGHPVRYHTDCSVIANNFLLTPQHEQKIIEADLLLQLTPEQLQSLAPDVKYLFVRLYGVFKLGPNGYVPTPLDELASNNAPLFVALTTTDELPSGFQLLGELRVEDERDIAFARVFKIVPP